MLILFTLAMSVRVGGAARNFNDPNIRNFESRHVRNSEEHMVAGCRSVELSCPRESLLVITHATFNQNRMVASSCLEGLKDSGSILEQRSVLSAVVGRCSGTRGSTCRFDIEVDMPQSKQWGRGMIEVRYSCEKDVSSYCGGILTVSSPGYVSSPAYPKYYLGGRDCIWTLAAARGQRIEVTVLDLSLRSDNGPSCEDSVRVAEDNNILMDLCGDLDTPRAVVSEGEEVEVRMRTAASRQQLYPRRGMLMRYTPLGCPTPPAPADGIILARNQSHLQLACHKGHVFVSTLSAQITLTCRDYKWSSWPMEHCVSVTFLMQYGNQSIVTSLMSSHAQLSHQQLSYTLRSRGEWGLEVVATVIVGILLVASLALALLLFVRHRHLDREWQEDRVNLNESRTSENIQGSLQKY